MRENSMNYEENENSKRISLVARKSSDERFFTL